MDKVPERVRDPQPVCRACRKPVDWRNLKTDEREFQPHVFERVYFCPFCRAILDYASWQTGDR